MKALISIVVHTNKTFHCFSVFWREKMVCFIKKKIFVIFRFYLYNFTE